LPGVYGLADVTVKTVVLDENDGVTVANVLNGPPGLHVEAALSTKSVWL
jgi:hypothetical protein